MPFVIYSVACSEARAEEPLIAAFRSWLFAEIATEHRAGMSLDAAAE